MIAKPQTEQPTIGTSPFSIFGRNNNLPLHSTDEKRTFTGLNVKELDIKEQTNSIKKFAITGRYEFRPDLLSYFFYQNPLLGWYICEYNGIVDPFDPETGLYIGRLISIPSKTQLLAGFY